MKVEIDFNELISRIVQKELMVISSDSTTAAQKAVYIVDSLFCAMLCVIDSIDSPTPDKLENYVSGLIQEMIQALKRFENDKIEEFRNKPSQPSKSLKEHMKREPSIAIH